MWFGLIVLLVFAVWAFTGYDFALVVSSLASADWRWICVGVGLNVLLLYLRVYKWRFFNSAFRDFSYFNMSLAAFAAYTCNMVVPAKVGAFVQAWLLSQKEPIPASKAFYVIDVPMYLPLCIILAQAVGFMIPSPGYVGPFHAATVTALSFFDISGELALSIAIMMHAALFVTNSLPGIIYLWIENLNVVAVIKKAKDGFG
jgi:uncharacterized membrane protein YbhN (UPF0104 family)